ncbi:hypothetical protein D3C73_1008830 [compost metagenome]
MGHCSQELRLILGCQHQLSRPFLQGNLVLVQFFRLGGHQLIRSDNLPVTQQLQLKIADDEGEQQTEHYSGR